MNTLLTIGIIVSAVITVIYFVLKSVISDINEYYFDNDEDLTDIY